MVFDVLTDANPFTAQTNTIAYFGTIYGPTYDILSPVFTNETNVYSVPSVSSTETNYESPYNDPWYYSLFTNNGNNSYSGFSFFAYVDDLTLIPVTTTTTIPFTPTPTPSAVNPCATATPASSPTPTPTAVNTNCYTGTINGSVYYYTGTSYTNFDNLVVGTLRSRGIATYEDSTNPLFEVTNINNVNLFSM